VTADDPAFPSASDRWLRFVVLAALAIAAGLTWYAVGGDPGTIVRNVERLGAWGMAVFVAAYAVAVVALVPASVLTLAAGALFGVAVGVPLVFGAATLGACGAFLVSRYVAGRWVERRLTDLPRFAAIADAVAANGFSLVFLLRLSPVVPFTLLNYALGITRVRFRDYALASVGMLPGTVLYVYSGSVAREVASVAGGEAAPDVLRWVVLGLGLAATAVATVLITKAARRSLEARIAHDRSSPARRP
jgi:uncharacterized membrane protein YdjX (TVP38/TMEM64 family)